MKGNSRFALALLIVFAIAAGLWVTVFAAHLSPRLGLDLKGGVSVILTPVRASGTGAIPTEALDKTVDIIRSRINAFGVAESDISTQGGNILVQIPGVKDRQTALELIGKTAQLRFRPVLAEYLPKAEDYKTVGPDCSSNPATEVDPTKEVVLCVRARGEAGAEDLPTSQWTKLRLGAVALDGTDVATARAVTDTTTAGLGAWEASLSLSGAGDKKFADITSKLACNQGVTRQLGIELDGVVESHPQMAEDVKCGEGISGGSARITGMSEKEAKNLALVLRTGALPLTLEPSQTQTVSPTLGRQSLRAGLIAGLIGLALVFLYVLLYYRGLGLVIWAQLGVFAAIMVGVVTVLGEVIGFSLTLAGIAGIIVAIGITADSSVVFFERLKEEVKGGRTLRSGVDRGYKRSFRTTVAADTVSFSAAVILYLLAVGPVRGFAFTLGIATLLDLFLSYFFTRPLVSLLVQTKLFTEGAFVGIRRAV
ncbi:MAG: protein translocase subunit SecD [Actinomycetota bacterium]